MPCARRWTRRAGHCSKTTYATAFSQAALAAELAPWRLDLPLLAARYALQSGQPLQAIDILEQPHLASQLAPADLAGAGGCLPASRGQR